MRPQLPDAWIGLNFLDLKSEVAFQKVSEGVTVLCADNARAGDVTKIAAMKRAIGAAPLAIASGITPENVGGYLGICDYFLIATGISSSVSELNAARVMQLARAIHWSR